MPPDGPDGEFSLLPFSTEPSAGPRLLGEAGFLEDAKWGQGEVGVGKVFHHYSMVAIGCPRPWQSLLLFLR